ncbi:hypothetical protein OESDEN_05837 [Oesophagostomum dentatum]|uniref:G-protein coupled receptors family 1 profile domain-containing protein n=1 Tax=Oesophagostomum dentatum TaxID=61180 RepID=A0A0B1TFS2_OESDE|nr:hypothetical protein OESDEN_05837 [Oesophagostomum dentatum]
MIMIRLNPALKNSFGILCFSQTVASFGTALTFLFWVTPLTLMGSLSYQELPAKLVGQVMILFWNASIYSHLAISINRLVAIAFVHRVVTIFTTRNTVFIVILVWIVAFCYVIPYFWGKTILLRSELH